ncbi:NAD+ synthase [Halorussus salinus]|uniref:NAD+ synthase n=1 Tax=Halorussus salinus TaxID=1364935 RepID=UPI0010925AB5|nr:NAD+ synthase [Halorussus salinus]
MPDTLSVALAQGNYLVGDVEGNAAKIERAVGRATDADADLLVCSELALLGYPPRDLVEREGLLDAQDDALARLAELTDEEFALLVGFAERNPAETGRPLYNAAAFCHGGELAGTTRKRLLPTYDVFEEDRYFERSERTVVHDFRGVGLGVHVCEDAWNEPDVWERPRYAADPVADLADAGADLLVNLSASPFYAGKGDERTALMASHATDHDLPFVFVNQVGANDELVFDGRSFVVGPEGEEARRLAEFEADFAVCEVALDGPSDEQTLAPVARDGTEEVRRAVELGIRDYVRKTGFEGVLVGLSGGVDSSVAAALATEALGPENVLGVAMATRYTSDASEEDAAALAEALGIEFLDAPIEDAFGAFEELLDAAVGERERSVTDENVQARVRGTTLMALSNELGLLVLATSNKSELATGYCTLYGDMCGALAPLADCPKEIVYDLARRVNDELEGGGPIPRRVLERPPSAELAPDQTDQDALPPYEVLDDVLRQYVGEGATAEEIVSSGHDPSVVREILALVHGSEFKRWQAAPVLKVTRKAFGVGWRYPLAATYERVINQIPR